MRSDIWHQVHRLHGEGLSIDTIARSVGRAAYRVRRLLMESGAIARQYRYGIRDYRLLAAYREGLTHREICERFHVPTSVLLTVLRVHAEPPRPRRQPMDPEIAQAVLADYLDSELTVREICRMHGISAAALDRLLDEQDVPRRTPPTSPSRSSRAWKAA